MLSAGHFQAPLCFILPRWIGYLRAVITFDSGAPFRTTSLSSLLVSDELLKMSVLPLSRTAQDEPIIAIHGGRLANDEAQDIICSKTGIRTEMMSITKVAVLRRIMFCVSSFAGRPP